MLDTPVVVGKGILPMRPLRLDAHKISFRACCVKSLPVIARWRPPVNSWPNAGVGAISLRFPRRFASLNEVKTPRPRRLRAVRLRVGKGRPR